MLPASPAAASGESDLVGPLFANCQLTLAPLVVELGQATGSVTAGTSLPSPSPVSWGLRVGGARACRCGGPE